MYPDIVYQNAARMVGGGGYMPQGFSQQAPKLKIPAGPQGGMSSGMAQQPSQTRPGPGTTGLGSMGTTGAGYGPYGVQSQPDWAWGGQQQVESDLALRNAMAQLAATQKYNTWKTQYDTAATAEQNEMNRQFQRTSQIEDQQNQTYQAAVQNMYNYGWS